MSDRSHAELPERVESALATPPLAASPTSQRLLRWLLAETEAGRRPGQGEVAEAVFGDSSRTARARGAIRELRRRLAMIGFDDSGTRLALSDSPWRLRLEEEPCSSPDALPSSARRHHLRRWQAVAGALLLALTCGAAMRVLAQGRGHGASRRELAGVRFDTKTATVAGVNAWGEELWRHRVSGGSGREPTDPTALSALLDLDDDGSRDAVYFSPIASARVEQPLTARRADGELLFEEPAWRLLGAPATLGLLHPVVVVPLPREGTGLEQSRVLFMACALGEERSWISLVDSEGRRVSGFELSGRFDRAEFLDFDGEAPAELALAGTLDDAGEPRVVLSLAGLAGLDAGQAPTEVARLAFPRPLQGLWNRDDPFLVHSLHARDGWLQAEIEVGRNVGLWLYVDRRLQPAVRVGDSYSLAWLHANGLDTHESGFPRNAHEARLAETIEVWP